MTAMPGDYLLMRSWIVIMEVGAGRSATFSPARSDGDHPIGLDHVALFLWGRRDLASPITGEKAGIIKPGILVLGK